MGANLVKSLLLSGFRELAHLSCSVIHRRIKFLYLDSPTMAELKKDSPEKTYMIKAEIARYLIVLLPFNLSYLAFTAAWQVRTSTLLRLSNGRILLK